jgi:hypothetical protein
LLLMTQEHGDALLAFQPLRNGKKAGPGRVLGHQ